MLGEPRDLTKNHGYILEVPGRRNRRSDTPYKAMGRFSHEAVAVDPATGWRLRDGRRRVATSGFYRFRPTSQGAAAATAGLSRCSASQGTPQFDTRTEPDRGLARRRVAHHRHSPIRISPLGETEVFSAGLHERRRAVRAPRRGVARPRPHLLPVDERRRTPARGRSSRYDPLEERGCGCCSNRLPRTSSMRRTTCASARAAASCSARMAAAPSTCTA